jgi:ABC-type sugar transport system ATPase subunit
MSKIVIKNLEKSFGDNKVINNFNIDINDGEFIVLVGPSGCGKSTLLRMISGLESINQGEIFLDEKLINNLLPSKREIAMVFQSYALYPHMSVFENMSFGLKMEKIDKDEINQKVNDAAATLQIKDLLERKPKQLSGGQRQRVAIGRAITRNPKVFLFDEPLSNLDAALRSEMRVEISKLHKKLKSNIIYVTHDQIEAMTLADRIVVLNKGNIEQFGTPSEIYSDPNNIFVAEFIGSPKMNIIKINKEQIINSKTLSLFNNKITFENFEFKDEIYLGIRPEDISLENNHEIQVDVKIDHVENLGFEKIVYSKVLENQIIIKSSKNINNHSLKISFSKDKVLFFDKDKNRIR